MRYIPNSPADRAAMLAAIGVTTIEDLFRGIPDELRLKSQLDLPAAMSEPELLEYFASAAANNQTDRLSFLGAGIYSHYVPLIIDALISRSEFFTAYTPYQAEIAQGTLQAIFEFQTYMAQLTGMDIANASLYDGSTALAEGILMAHRITRRSRFIVARSVHPEYRAVVETYTSRLGLEIESVDFLENGRIDMEMLESGLTPDTAGVIVQSPNFFGTIEALDAVAALAHSKGALAIVNVAEAMSLGLLRPPGDAPSEEGRADIVVGEAQSLGVPMSFGGPHVGFVATRHRFLRQIPGRLVGMGHDGSGKRGFVLTLATREQHIRREKATSNICTNQSLCALMTTIYLSTVGPKGLRDIAIQNIEKTAYATDRIESDTKHSVRFPGPRFNEFVIKLDGGSVDAIDRLSQQDIVAGLPMGRFFPELDDSLLVSITEVHKKSDIDRLIEGLE